MRLVRSKIFSSKPLRTLATRASTGGLGRSVVTFMSVSKVCVKGERWGFAIRCLGLGYAWEQSFAPDTSDISSACLYCTAKRRVLYPTPKTLRCASPLTCAWQLGKLANWYIASVCVCGSRDSHLWRLWYRIAWLLDQIASWSR